MGQTIKGTWNSDVIYIIQIILFCHPKRHNSNTVARSMPDLQQTWISSTKIQTLTWFMTYIGDTIDSTPAGRTHFSGCPVSHFWQVTKSDLSAKHEIVSLQSCFTSEGLQRFSCDIYYGSFAKLTRTHLCVACFLFFFLEWKNHENTHLRVLFFVFTSCHSTERMCSCNKR